jgi:hypothetical protein
LEKRAIVSSKAVKHNTPVFLSVPASVVLVKYTFARFNEAGRES